MKTNLFILLIAFLGSCSNKKGELFEKSLDIYIKNHPIGVSYQIDDHKNKRRVNCNYPSYHAYFFADSLNNEKVILHRELYFTLDVIPDKFSNKYWNSIDFKLKGFFMYQNDKPIFIHDQQNFSDKYLSNDLEIAIPDSLLFDIDRCDGSLDVMHLRDNNPKLYLLNNNI